MTYTEYLHSYMERCDIDQEKLVNKSFVIHELLEMIIDGKSHDVGRDVVIVLGIELGMNQNIINHCLELCSHPVLNKEDGRDKIFLKFIRKAAPSIFELDNTLEYYGYERIRRSGDTRQLNELIDKYPESQVFSSILKIQHFKEPFNVYLHRQLKLYNKNHPGAKLSQERHAEVADVSFATYKKITSGKTILPARDKVIQLGLPLGLSIDEHNAMMRKLGYALLDSEKPNDPRDVVFIECIEGKLGVKEANDKLAAAGLRPLSNSKDSASDDKAKHSTGLESSTLCAEELKRLLHEYCYERGTSQFDFAYIAGLSLETFKSVFTEKGIKNNDNIMQVCIALELSWPQIEEIFALKGIKLDKTEPRMSIIYHNITKRKKYDVEFINDELIENGQEGFKNFNTGE